MNTLHRLGLLALFVVAGLQAAPIRLVVNPWPASELNAEVAKALLRSEFGREVTTIKADERAQWDLLAKGEADASLELWPSGHADAWRAHVDEARDVVSGGPLGVRGQIGWFTPREVVKAHPKLATWRGFLSGGEAEVFASQPGARGRLLTGDPTWTQFDEEIVRNLKLELDVVPLGSEAELVRAARVAVGQGEPILFYLYSPHALFREMNLVMVELPPHDAAMWKKAGKGGAACAYPSEDLVKIFSARLAKTDGEAEAFLRAMRLDNQAQIEMLAMADIGYSPADAAATWIMANPHVWRPWVVTARAGKK